MQMRMLACLISGLIAIVALGACATSGNAPVEAVNAAGTEMVRLSQTQEQPQYRFYPGDELSVTAVNRPELTVGLVRVDPYGYISYPYLGQVNVKDLTSQEVADRLTRGLQDGDYYKRVALRVSFVGAKEQYVYVLGEVRTPGPIPITGGIPLLEAIGKAGGKTYDAEMSTVLWIRGRQSPPAVVKLDLNALGDPRSSDPKILNFTLIPGDVIYIPDSVIVSVQRFFNRMYDILRPIVLLESGIVLYDSVERVLTGRYYANKPGGGGGTTTIIVTPTTR